MIRQYLRADCEDVVDVWAGASALAHSFLGREFLERERRMIRKVFLPKAETWVWEAGGQVVGFISLLGNEVGALFVVPGLQGSGIGQALLDRARTLKGELEVEVFTRNAHARSFYEKYGFEVTGRRVHDETGFEITRLRLAAAARTATSGRRSTASRSTSRRHRRAR